MSVTKTIWDQDKGLPIVLESRDRGVDLAAWVRDDQAVVDGALREHGAVLLRGFRVPDVAAFAEAGRAICGELSAYDDSGGGPRRAVGDRVYTSTSYPAERKIPLHFDGMSMLTWPSRILFYCVQPARSRGGTPVADLRRVLAGIDPGVLRRFVDKGVLYVRNFRKGFGIPWQSSFQVATHEELEDICRRGNIWFEWAANGSLRTRQSAPATAIHPVTGESVWFNQALGLHVSSLEPELRTSLTRAFKPEDLPLNSYYGDGSVIPDSDMDAVRRALDREEVVFPWHLHDVMVLDNMQVVHGREPFEGPRQIVVSMSGPLSWDIVQSADADLRALR